MKRAQAVLLAAAVAWPAAARAEILGTTLVEGLKSPSKIILTPEGNLLVAETGNLPPAFVPNSGRVSLIDRSGARRTVLDGLPSGLDLENNNPLGPAGLWITGRRTLYVAIGSGDTTKRNATGAEVPNPSGPSSALFSSLWRIRFSRPIDDLADGFTISPAADGGHLADGDDVHLANAAGDEADVRVLADLRDPYPGVPPPVISASNPFGLARIGDDFYVPDGGQNSVVRIDGESGRIRTVAHLPAVPNTAPFGPPMSQAVPTTIRGAGPGSALVTLFTGFPFGVGASKVQMVDLRAGTAETVLSNLTMAIDVLSLGDRGPLLVLEFASRFVPPSPAGPAHFVPPGRVLRFADPSSAPEVVTTGLTGATSMVFDECTGELFVTELRAGRIVRFQL